MPPYTFAVGNVRMYLRIGPKTRTNRLFSKTRPDKGQKEYVSGETRTYGNPSIAVKCNGTNVQLELHKLQLGLHILCRTTLGQTLMYAASVFDFFSLFLAPFCTGIALAD